MVATSVCLDWLGTWHTLGPIFPRLKLVLPQAAAPQSKTGAARRSLKPLVGERFLFLPFLIKWVGLFLLFFS